MKSQFRKDVEAGLLAVGSTARQNLVFMDKRMKFRRLKFARVFLTASQKIKLQKTLQNKYNTTVEVGETIGSNNPYSLYSSSYAGTTVKLYY